jgi:hypothetical protein
LREGRRWPRRLVRQCRMLQHVIGSAHVDAGQPVESARLVA